MWDDVLTSSCCCCCCRAATCPSWSVKLVICLRSVNDRDYEGSGASNIQLSHVFFSILFSVDQIYDRFSLCGWISVNFFKSVVSSTCFTAAIALSLHAIKFKYQIKQFKCPYLVCSALLKQFTHLQIYRIALFSFSFRLDAIFCACWWLPTLIRCILH